MNARAIWKGVIHYGSVRLPVRLYSAIEDHSIHFHLLHDQDLARVKQRLANPSNDETVAYTDARHGYQVESGVFVILDKSELESLEPEDSRDIEITRFVASDRIDPAWHERPYYLGPDGDESDYVAFAQAMAQEDKAGIARWVMRKKRYVGVLRSEGDYLVLITLRYAEQVIAPSQLSPPPGRKPTKKEQQLAEKLIATLDDKFQADDYRDEYRHRVMELIDSKSKGAKVAIKKYRTKPRRGTLTEMLQASLAGESFNPQPQARTNRA